MASLKNRKIENGSVIGFVRLANTIGDPEEFEICSIEEWKNMSKEEAEQAALVAKIESGLIEWWY